MSLPNWASLAMAGVASLIGASVGVFTSRDNWRFVRGWFLSSLGLATGWLVSLAIDPPRPARDPDGVPAQFTVDLSVVIIASVILGLVPVLVVAGVWACRRST